MQANFRRYSTPTTLSIMSNKISGQTFIDLVFVLVFGHLKGSDGMPIVFGQQDLVLCTLQAFGYIYKLLSGT